MQCSQPQTSVHTVFSLADGKYEITRNAQGLITDVQRNGEPWPTGFELIRHMGIFHAALNEIERLQAQPVSLARPG